MRKKDIGWQDENEDGEKIEISATRGRAVYSFKYRLKGGDEWIELAKPPRAFLEALHEVLELRYRRRRASLREVEIVEKMIKALP